jgi:predicted phosphodiesterase
LKWLIFGDVHGNLPALEKLLATEKNNYDAIVCHGDLVNYGPWSNECVQLMSGLSNAILLKGNHEVYFTEGVYPGTHLVAKAFFSYCYPSFTEFDLIGKYEMSRQVGIYTVQHTIKDEYIFSNTLLTTYDITQNYIIGHSHQQYRRFVGNYKLLNTGSLGQNRNFINVANYILYDIEKETIELKHFVYNIDVVINKMESAGYSDLCLSYYRNKKRV